MCRTMPDAGNNAGKWVGGQWVGQGASGEPRELPGQAPGHVCSRRPPGPLVLPRRPCRQGAVAPLPPPSGQFWLRLLLPRVPSLLPTPAASSPFSPVGGPRVAGAFSAGAGAHSGMGWRLPRAEAMPRMLQVDEAGSG